PTSSTLCCTSSFSFYGSADSRDLHSFPTRRSSDLAALMRPSSTVCAVAGSPPSASARALPSSYSHCETISPGRSPVSPAEIVSRSEEHTSELQSRFDLVCRLLLEKKKKEQ